jgi:hypothetical protein
VDDDVLDRFCIAGTYATIAERVGARFGGQIDRVSLALPANAAEDRDRIAGAVRDLRSVPAARQQRR